MEAKLEVVRREVIKPHHDPLQLSLLDVSMPAVYISTIFFYNTVAGESQETISGRLKTSLSETLSRFYPLAERIEGVSVSCNNEGALFTEARTNLLLAEFLKNNCSLEELVPTFEPGESAGTWPLLSVKAIFFGSGSGVAIGVAIYPSPPGTSCGSVDNGFQVRTKSVTNRFVFKSSKIAELKLKAASESVPVPTRVEAISSLIWRCAANASRSNSVTPKSTLMTQAMDLRLRIPSTVLSQDAIGNLHSVFLLKKGPESEMEIGEIVAEFRKAKEGINEMIKEHLQTPALGQTLLCALGKFVSELKPDSNLYGMTSWCKKPFYKVDFGWGTPVWMGSVFHTIHDKMVVLIDSKDGEDVEAWVGLPEQDMAFFVCDEDLLAYALLNPPVLI